MIGKFLCGLCGLLLAGPVGLVIGIIIGYFFDRGLTHYLKNQWAFRNQNTEAQKVFFTTTFQVMGYIAKADGVVTEEELQQARDIMRQLNLNEQQRKSAITAFTEGKQADFNLEKTLEYFISKCKQQRLLLQLFIEFQTRAATINGKLDPLKANIIKQIAQKLGFAPYQNFNFEHFFKAFNEFSQQAGQRQSRPNQKNMSQDQAYQILGASRSDSDTEIKKKYRKLISQNHPDKLMAKGLPPTMLKLATEKTQQIQMAYDQICSARGIK